jgi:hypothetical protein
MWPSQYLRVVPIVLAGDNPHDVKWQATLAPCELGSARKRFARGLGDLMAACGAAETYLARRPSRSYGSQPPATLVALLMIR